ncbi:MAG: phosphotransferase [Nocardioidaceae bacterium]|nr:phosphotransferase [Nocardioidaceae bacterium]
MVEPIPFGRTARRLEWQHLPARVRSWIEERCGSPVVDAASQGGGFTPGFASVLTCADSSRVFVKAASVQAQGLFAASYREEARKLTGLPQGVPAARLLWSRDDDWVVLGLEYVAGRPPRRPWQVAELDRVLDELESVADLLTPAPSALDLEPVEHEFADLVAAWDHVRTSHPALPHLEEAAALAAAHVEVTAGDTLVHTDLRADNVIVGDDGRVWLCDWNWPVVGAAWIDTLLLLVEARGDGIDADELLARRALTRDIPADHVDRMIALLAGYFLRQAQLPVPPTSPYLRQHQAWCAGVVWDWLCERRGWS